MSRTKSWRGARIFTVGHSTRTLDELVALFRAFDISVLADIRSIPQSRHNPQFNGDALRSTLRSRRLRYGHLPELGGLRRPRKDSPNTGWRNASFRGFADYMLTEDFETGLAKLHALTAEGRVSLRFRRPQDGRHRRRRRAVQRGPFPCWPGRSLPERVAMTSIPGCKMPA